jgi:hypothetical protein
MGNFRFYRRRHIFPGLSVNVSKSGPSLTVGVRGAHLTMGPSGVRRTVGIPGTGHLLHLAQRLPERSSFGARRYSDQSRAAAVRHSVGGWLALAAIVGIALVIGIAIGSARH